MTKLAIICVIVLFWIGATTAIPSPDEERYLDKEYTRELVGWLATLNPGVNNPCRFYTGSNFLGAMPKRNSELINSLLSLPKTMNDAGK